MASRYQIMTGDISFEAGKSQDFVAVKEFALNFDDRKIKSVKIRVNDILSFDGETASYKKTTGEMVLGKVNSLKSVINRAKWLIPVVTGKKTKVSVPEPVDPRDDALVVPEKQDPQDFDSKRGGNFNSFMEVEKNKTAKSNIIREEDRIVKMTTAAGKKEE